MRTDAFSSSAFPSSAFPSHIDTHSCIFSFHEYLLLQVLAPVHTPLAPVKSPVGIFTSHVKWMNSEKVSRLVSGVRLRSHLDLYFISTAACEIRPRYDVVVLTITPLYLGNAHTVQWGFRTFILEGTNGHFQPESELLCIDAFDLAEELVSVFSSSHPRVCHLSTRHQVNVAIKTTKQTGC